MLNICFNVIYEYTSLSVRNQASSLGVAYMRGVLDSNRFKISMCLKFSNLSMVIFQFLFICMIQLHRDTRPCWTESQTYLQHPFEISPLTEIVVRVCAFLRYLFNMCRNLSTFELRKSEYWNDCTSCEIKKLNCSYCKIYRLG